MNRNIKNLRGIIPPMVTPMIDDETLDNAGIKRLVSHIISGGVHGIFILGTTGEAQSLTYKLRYELVEQVCNEVSQRVPLLVGITDTSFKESLRLAEHAEHCGANAVVAAPPYYFAPSQQELIEYYTALADHLKLPLFLYNMPSHVKVYIEPQTVRVLSKHPNILGLKDSSSNMVYFQSLMYNKEPEFSLFVGPEEITAETIMMGASGGINGGANLFPKMYVDIYNAACKYDIIRVHELQQKIMRISSGIYTIGKFGSSYLKGVKCALSLMGICNDYMSYPYRKFKDKEKDKVRCILDEINSIFI